LSACCPSRASGWSASWRRRRARRPCEGGCVCVCVCGGGQSWRRRQARRPCEGGGAGGRGVY
jgi:hypothetical protein